MIVHVCACVMHRCLLYAIYIQTLSLSHTTHRLYTYDLKFNAHVLMHAYALT